MALDRDEYRPGMEIYVDVAAASDSYFALQAIDQSVLIVDSGSYGFSKTDVLNDLALYDPQTSGPNGFLSVSFIKQNS